MSVGLLLISHNELASNLLETATKMLGRCPLTTETLTVSISSDPSLMQEQALAMYHDLDQGDGVLILTDMYGSTPSNIASRLLEKNRSALVTGLNLPMLVRVLNYADLNLPELAAKALSGGCDGVIAVNPEE
jgi:PTS system mannose-specific IIA component